MTNYTPAHGDKLKFECTLCGNCCRNVNVPVTMDEAKKISETLNRASASLFEVVGYIGEGGERQQYMSMRRKKNGENFECQFLVDNKCSIHELGIKPANCQHVPYSLIDEHEAKDWYENERVKAEVDAGGRKVYFSSLEACPGIGKGDKIQKDQLVKEMVEQQNKLVVTSKLIAKGQILVTEKDREMVSRMRQIGVKCGQFDSHQGFSFAVYPPQFFEEIHRDKLVECVKEAKGFEGLFRISILKEGEERGILVGYLKNYKEPQFVDRFAKLKDLDHRFGVIDLDKGEYTLLF
ncbi:MAG: YkgJ family cysteine cluster protein [archaeon]